MRYSFVLLLTLSLILPSVFAKNIVMEDIVVGIAHNDSRTIEKVITSSEKDKESIVMEDIIVG